MLLNVFAARMECPGLGLLLVHVAGPFKQISGMEVEEGMKLMELNVNTLSTLVHIAL